MSEEERRRCCILGGCGCTPGGAQQIAALAEFIEGFEGKSREALAAALLQLFGTGPHEKQLAALADG